MSVGLLCWRCAYRASYIDIVGFQSFIFIDAIFCWPDNHSQLKIIERRRMDFVRRSCEPVFLLNQIDPHLESSLSSTPIFWIEISELNGFFPCEKMPFLHEVSFFYVNISVSENFRRNVPKNSINFHYIDPDSWWSWQFHWYFLANVELRV